jgi:hypothetical protein
MSFKTPVKNISIIIAIISFASGALIYNYAPVIFQEGNPWPEIKAIFNLSSGGSDMVKIAGDDFVSLGQWNITFRKKLDEKIEERFKQ